VSIRILYLCTGNAARSVMGVTMTRAWAGDAVEVRGAGTFSIPGQPMSPRTRESLKRLGLSDPHHRSHQLERDDTTWADVIVGFEPQHVEYVRREHRGAAWRTATLPRLVRDIGVADQPLAERLASLALHTVELERWEEVVDPAGGDQPIYDACADEVAGLVRALLPALGVSSGVGA
jgi:protein-tyrosine-phosphatase